MLLLTHRLIVMLYLVMPIWALFTAIFRRKVAADERPRIRDFSMTVIAGLAIGLALCLVYAVGTGGRLVVSQVALAGYFAVSLLLILKLLDRLLTAALVQIAGLRQINPTRSKTRRRLRNTGVAIVRLGILFTFGLPYVMASGMTYRAKVIPVDDPKQQMGVDFERVTFSAIDGTKIVGWWIPAQGVPLGLRENDWGTRTVIACHGLASNKSNQLVMARAFPSEGFNVLIFDFRGHGESAGQLSTFGDRERLDVLAAVAYLKSNRPDAAQHIYGVGASLGGAALIAAASEDSDDARSIEAIAVYGTFDRLSELSQSIAQDFFFPPLRQLLQRFGLPLASIQTGADLVHFSPAEVVPNLWPRPILIIHGRRDEIIRFTHGEKLFDAATLPKYHLWIDEGGHNDVITNASAATIVLEFFRSAKPEPII